MGSSCIREDFENLIWSDKSKFEVFSSKGKVYVHQSDKERCY